MSWMRTMEASTAMEIRGTFIMARKRILEASPGEVVWCSRRETWPSSCLERILISFIELKIYIKVTVIFTMVTMTWCLIMTTSIMKTKAINMMMDSIILTTNLKVGHYLYMSISP